MGTLSQRESGWWQAKVRRKGHPVQSKTFSSKKEAEAWARAVESEMDRGIFLARSTAEQNTLSDIAKRFKEEFAPFHYRKRADENEAWRTQVAHLSRELGSYAIASITSPVVAQYRDHRLKLVSGSTVKKEMDMLSKMLTVASQEFGIVLPFGNPVANVRKPRAASARTRRLEGNEEARLLKQCTASVLS